MEVKCTQCGGNVPVQLEQGLATCPYCGSSLFVSIREGYLHYLLKPMLPERDIEKVLRTYLQRLERRSSFTIKRTSMVFWPFWQTQEGEELGTFIAATHPITSLEDADILSGDARPFLQSETGDVWVEPPSERLEELIERQGIAPTKVWLVHCPFWAVNYEYDGITYEVWVDAVRGKAFADELPPTFEKQKDRLYAMAALVIFGVFFLLGVAGSGSIVALLLYAAASIPLYFVVKKMIEGVMS